MLIVEKTANGQRIVKVERDWNPSRISQAYHRPKYHYMDTDACRVQKFLLKVGDLKNQ